MKPSSPLRRWPSLLTAGVIVLPILCIVAQSFTIDFATWSYLWTNRIPGLMLNSLLLVITVSLGSFLIGTCLAFLMERTDLPLKRLWEVLLIAPLITPCYIIAICYVNFFGIKGLGEKAFHAVGIPIGLPSIYGFWGAALILTLGSYPYIYMLVKSSLHRIDPVFSEAARCLGKGRIERFFTVTMPLLAPAYSAGSILVALYVLSDFGVVSMLRYPTFVNTIYEQMSSRYNYATATSLSSVLIALTLGLFLIQETLIKSKQFTSAQGKSAHPQLVSLNWLRLPALLTVGGIVTMGLLIPLAILIYWAVQSATVIDPLRIWSSSSATLMRSGFISLFLSATVATVAVTLALPLCYWQVREPASFWGKAANWCAQSGVALPGVLTALGLSIIFSKTIPALTYSVFSLMLAFLVHFFAQSLQTTRAGLAQISHRLEEASRMLGLNRTQTFWRVTRPLMKPALLTAWTLVFLSSMRELPASLLLRPAGFDPLTVKIWIAASEGFYEQAAFPALALILLSLPLVFIMLHTQKRVLIPESS